MLREFAEAVEAITVDRLAGVGPGGFALERPCHAGPDRLAGAAPVAARLLLLGTYRPVDVIVREHPLQAVHRDLMLHGQSAELRLEGLAEGAVAAYLGARFPGSTVATELARGLFQRTDGHPLFMVQTGGGLAAAGLGWRPWAGSGW